MELADAGFCHNFPWPPLLQRGVDIIISLDASQHVMVPGDGPTRLDAAPELVRAANAASRLPAGASRLPRVDAASYSSEAVSFHRDDRGGPLIVAIPLAGLLEDDAWCPLKNCHEGGFCASSTASYGPEDFDRLAEFAVARLRDNLPEIKRRIADHLRAKRDYSGEEVAV